MNVKFAGMKSLKKLWFFTDQTIIAVTPVSCYYVINSVEVTPPDKQYVEQAAA